MVDHLHAVLDALHGKKPLPIEETESRFEKMFKKPAKYLLSCSVMFFVALGLLTICVSLFDLSANNWAGLALLLFTATVGTAALWFIVDTFPALVWLFFFKDDAHRTRKLAVVHDLRHAKELHRFDIAALRLTDQWLALRIERMRLHMGVIIGGSDKVAVLALILGGWGIWTNFPGEDITLERYGYMMFSGFIGGLGVGGLMANIVIRNSHTSATCCPWH